MRELHRRVIGWLRENGATEARIEPARSLGHPRLIFVYHGQEYRRPIAGTPSDPNTAHIEIQQIRRLLGLRKDERRKASRRKKRAGRSRRTIETQRLSDGGLHRFVSDHGALNMPFAALAERMGTG